jgi:hypothetical protein
MHGAPGNFKMGDRAATVTAVFCLWNLEARWMEVHHYDYRTVANALHPHTARESAGRPGVVAALSKGDA